ncbi:hypothetical protein Tco_1427120 [Tanacetum coccineum]
MPEGHIGRDQRKDKMPSLKKLEHLFRLMVNSKCSEGRLHPRIYETLYARNSHRDWLGSSLSHPIRDST